MVWLSKPFHGTDMNQEITDWKPDQLFICCHSPRSQNENEVTVCSLPVAPQCCVEMSWTMQSATLLLFLSVILTAVAAPASLDEAAGCEWTGQHYREGETIYPDRCQLCFCHNGTVQCSTPPCPPAPCPETVPDPEQCGCPACPPGELW